MASKVGQRAPKVTQRALKRGPERVLKAKGAPRASQRPPEGHFGVIFVQFWVIFGYFFEYLLYYFGVETGSEEQKNTQQTHKHTKTQIHKRCRNSQNNVENILQNGSLLMDSVRRA